MSRSMANRASIRWTASSASGEMAGCLALRSRRAAAARSASSKNLRRAWAQQPASRIGRPRHRIELAIAAIGVGLQDAAPALRDGAAGCSPERSRE